MTSDAVRAYRPGLPDPSPLLTAYRTGDFLFATAERTLLARGVDVDLSTFDDLDAVSAAVASSEASLAVGALPYDTTDGSAHRARLVVPRSVQVAEPVRAGTLAPVPVGAPSSVVAVPSEDDHIAAVRKAIEAVSHGVPAKAVLARVLDVSFSDAVSPASIVNNLIVDNPDGFTFAVDLPGGATLVGSSPELLVRRSGLTVTAHPQAGTAARSDDPAVDRARASALLASGKDLSEHAIVVEAVVEALRPFCRSLSVPSSPSLTATPAVWHLGTQITGSLSDDVSALRLAAALHPTPAVCGAPTAAARDLVSALEPFDRGFYAGAVGWVDAAGDGEWAVSIRCAEMSGSSMRLYAGGGIVAESDAVAELDETTAKFTTLLRAMGVAPTVV